MKKLTVLVDMDETLVDLISYWLRFVNQDHGCDVKVDDIQGWNMAAYVPCGNAVYEYLETPGFFLHPSPLAGALDGYQRLQAAGHRVVVVSAPSGPNSAGDKYRWIKNHMPFVSKQDIHLCQDKTMVDGDVLIDDRADTLLAYKARRPGALCIGISYPYNAAASQHLVGSHRDPASAWKEIVGAVERHAA